MSARDAEVPLGGQAAENGGRDAAQLDTIRNDLQSVPGGPTYREAVERFRTMLLQSAASGVLGDGHRDTANIARGFHRNGPLSGRHARAGLVTLTRISHQKGLHGASDSQYM